jgi:Na+/H+-dicarboxylate symporter
MTHYLQLIILFVLGFLGWTLFVYTLVSTMCNRTREIRMIKDISNELEKIRDDLKELK